MQDRSDIQAASASDFSSNAEHPIALSVMAALLKTGRMLDHASSVLLLCSLFLLHGTTTVISIAIALGVWSAIAEKYFAWRVALDAELFTVLSGSPRETAAFDSSLAALFCSTAIKPNRSMENRLSGAKALIKAQGICLLGQVALFAYSVVTRLFFV